jgi:SagB-type dehydrogenase family enzyme
LSQQTTHRASPSGGARHSLEIFLFARNVDGLNQAAYYYDPFDHQLAFLAPWDDTLETLQERLVIRPAMLSSSPQASLYITSVVRRVSWKYGAGSLALIYRDLGCLLQTMYLVATDLRLAPCAMGSVDRELSPGFLAQWRDEMIHVGTFALGVPTEPTVNDEQEAL